IPFIVVSGTIGEDVAVFVMRQGATDYLLKDRLARLPLAVQHALGQSRLLREREAAEKAMRESEHKHRHLYESLSDAAFLIECSSRRIVDTNPRGEALLGRTRAEILGMNLAGLFPDHDAAGIAAKITAASSTAQLDDTTVVASDGRTVPVRISFAPIELHGRQLVLALVADISEQKKNESALREAYEELRRTQHAAIQQERLRALGQMASGVAHDINNAICVVGIYAELLLANEPALSANARESLEMIHRAADDVGHTIARLREFYRPREIETKLVPVPLNRVVEEMASLTRARWHDIPQQRGTVIEFRADLAPGLPDILGIESELREALTNLVFNAVDAMPDGGTLTLRTRHLAPAADAAGEPPLRVAVEVIDTGAGMDEETRRRCLEPFFTTKGERGTGLGLAMVSSVAQRLQAGLEIESAQGRGTTVRLVFSAPASTRAAAPSSGPPALPRPRRVLLIDDEPAIVRAVSLVLEADGHAVTSALGGQAGIDAFTDALRRNEPFEIVVTDLGMPRVDGSKVASAVKAVSPGTPVILLTGWGHGVLDENNPPLNVDCVLSKPPRVREIREALAAVAVA
ncbi:MAG TPA: ATP-binding protein, partial [Chthoniobacteraceae bacterium]|nr:ATP-binding protein [Chthoniobacteraceae bacterium]